MKETHKCLEQDHVSLTKSSFSIQQLHELCATKLKHLAIDSSTTAAVRHLNHFFKLNAFTV